MISLESYNELVTFFYLKLAAVLQLLTFGFGLAACITRFRHQIIWIIALCCLGDSFVASILAYWTQIPSLANGIVLMYFWILFILLFYTFCRLAPFTDLLGKAENWYKRDNITYMLYFVIPIVLNIPMIVVIVWIIVTIISSLWNIFIWPLKTMIVGLPKTDLVKRFGINSTFTNTTGKIIKAINVTQAIKLT
jgi:hypothetical protein